VVETHPRPLRRADGREELQVVIRDVTSRVEAERAQRRLEEELRDARRMESLGRLAGGVAHDFRNLLTPVIVNASLLARQPLPGDGADLAREIGEAAERAGELVGHLLSFARRQIREVRVLDLNRVVRDLEPMLRRLIREDVELRLVLAPGLRALRADRSQLEQVLVNLAANARDAMPSGGRLTLETSEHLVSPEQAAHGRGLLSGHYAELAVTDTGEGMSATVREHLFEPFFTTKGSQKGTGLGLATVHGIVSQGGGAIRVESEPGRGTTFRVYLPTVDEAPEEGAPEPAAPTVRARDARVLVVDDEDMVRASVARVLRRAGFEVLEARDGAEGLEVARATRAPLHLLLTDVVMPRMAGPELASALREVHPGARVLFLSGYAEQGVVKGGELEPGVELLVKPFTPEVLLRRVDELLQG
jgi:signal transduction histidine kinase